MNSRIDREQFAGMVVCVVLSNKLNRGNINGLFKIIVDGAMR